VKNLCDKSQKFVMIDPGPRPMEGDAVRFLLAAFSCLLFALLVGCGITVFVSPHPSPSSVAADGTGDVSGDGSSTASTARIKMPDEPIAPFVEDALDWLAKAQHESGGWGAGSHSAQGVRDPHMVQTDPATTAFTAMAFLRVGSTPTSGKYSEQLRKAAEYLVAVVSEAEPNGPEITSLKGTQPQTKLGQFIDTSMTLQFLARVLATIPADHPLQEKVDKALDKCLAKLQSSQEQDGSWGGGSWAGVLQSSVGCSALEFAQAAGKTVDSRVLARAREHQKDNFDVESGRASAPDSAGVELYAFAGSQRAAASEAGAARRLIEQGIKDEKLAVDAECNVDNLVILGVVEDKARILVHSYELSVAQIRQLDNEQLLTGFGNNGGEEFLSYMLTSESLVLQGGDAWPLWKKKMNTRMAKIQVANGSWTGHHCITSPVFCTAAVVQCLTADRDGELLRIMNDLDAAASTESL